MLQIRERHIISLIEQKVGGARGIEIAAKSRLVVTVDCGITALAEAQFALDEGIELIITDHHQPGEILPEALAVVNPNRTDCRYPTKELAGVGVAFKLAQAVALLVVGDANRANEVILKYIDLVALGTVADVVPLIGENRILVHMGLERFGLSSVGLEYMEQLNWKTGSSQPAIWRLDWLLASMPWEGWMMPPRGYSCC